VDYRGTHTDPANSALGLPSNLTIGCGCARAASPGGVGVAKAVLWVTARRRGGPQAGHELLYLLARLTHEEKPTKSTGTSRFSLREYLTSKILMWCGPAQLD
jgi:hypothetical protein